MLTRTFQHLPGIGAGTEASLWASGLTRWQDLDGPLCPPLSPKRREVLVRGIAESRERMSLGDFRYFGDLLPAAQHWRLFPEVRDRAVYLDIETTGLDRDQGEITTVALYDGRIIRTFVQGRNLHEFPGAIREYDAVITYNGKCFDVPFLESYFSITMNQAHIDLRYVLKSLGYGGGLKHCETAFGIHRGDLDGVDGFDAVLLWREWRRTGRAEALETLLAYNVDDVVNLELLMVAAFNQKIHDTPFAGELTVEPPCQPPNPFRPEPALVQRLRASSPYRF